MATRTRRSGEVTTAARRHTPLPTHPKALTAGGHRPGQPSARSAPPVPSAPAPHATRGRRRAAPGPDSHERIFAAALVEFAARGVAGARVDQIAARAGLNKAMLYYHFGSKDRLYHAVIHHTLGRLASSLEAVVTGDRDPATKLDTYIETFVTLGLEEPHFAPLILREIAEGAARIDHDTVAVMLRVARALGAILSEGHRAGVFREVNPLLTYFTTGWPIMVYLATAGLRKTIAQHARLDSSGFAPERFVRHIQDLNRRALAVDANRPAVNPRAAARTTEH